MPKKMWIRKWTKEQKKNCLFLLFSALNYPMSVLFLFVPPFPLEYMIGLKVAVLHYKNPIKYMVSYGNQ